MMSRLALLTTAVLILVPPSLHAQSTLTRGGGSIAVLGPASAFQSAGPHAIHPAAVRGLATPAGMQPSKSNPSKGGGGGNGGGCQIYGFLGGLANGSTLSSIGVFDLTGQTTGNFSLGTATPTASAAGAVLSANLGAAPQGNVAGQVARNAGTLFQYATDPNCGAGTPFTTTLTSNPAGSSGSVVATVNTLSMQATYTTQYVADPNNPYYCYYTNNPNKQFLCNLWSANVTFNFLSNSFAALGAGTYTLNIVQATITSP
ncbi:MAG: hypothetical protein M0P72_04390 [Metallibacterium scheffleri]|jgi:hypothetical protein|uniref:hypothetical protein n=1 Tax=Metallibacterium scheffleri TaxID=993689 RepID=UPI0026EFC8F1|nr:hypothetical protein [Metallibacterium scheffleri]MCK9366376.1 hypothetical protein [Metallibacterium scheffleri]